MSDKHPLNINVKYTSASDCPKILMFDYEVPGGRKNLAYSVREHPKKEAFLKRGEISPDLSEVKTEEDSKKFKEEFMSKYPQADKVYEHLDEYEKMVTEDERRMRLNDVARVVHHNNSMGIKANLSEAERKESFEYLKALLKAKVEGRKSDDVPMVKRPLLDFLGIKKNNLYHVMANTKKDLDVQQLDKEQCSEILKNLPDKPFTTVEEGLEFPRKVSKWQDKVFQNKLSESINVVFGDFIDIKMRDDVGRLIDAKLKVHLQKLEKEKRLQRQKEEREAKKEKALEENKAKGAEVQKKMMKQKAAQQSLVEKGLLPKAGEKSGKDVSWGDSKALLKTTKGKSM